MKNHFNALFTALFFFGMLSLVQAQSDVKSVSDVVWKAYSQVDYVVEYPSNWDLDTSGTMGTKFIVLSPQEGVEDNFRESVNLVAQNLGGAAPSYEELAMMSKQQLTNMMSDVNFISSEPVKLGEVDAYELVYTAKQGMYDLKFNQTFLIDDGILYVLTFTSDVNKYDVYIIPANKIVETFKLAE